jgi:cytochrome P450
MPTSEFAGIDARPILQSMPTPTNVDVSATAFDSDPHPLYERLRAEQPVHRAQLPAGGTGWLVTRYDDVRRALTDSRLAKGRLASPTGYITGLPDDVRAGLTQHMLTADPPDHTRLRRLVAAAFTARRIEALRPRVQEITDELLDAMAGRDRVDLIDEFAFPLPLQVICELLGVPMSDRTSFRAWSNIIVAGSRARDEMPGAMVSMLGYLRELVTYKRGRPADDLLSALIAVSDEGDRLTPAELTSTMFLLLVAGHETTVNLIGNGTYLLLTHPEQFARLRADPALLPTAIEEFLRYESPVHLATFRVAVAELEIGGQVIAPGEPVLVSLLSANRDQERFADPARFDIGRPDGSHVAFGHGIHFCLGAPLARLEGQVAVASLVRRFPNLRLADPDEPVEWRAGALMHGLAALSVRA